MIKAFITLNASSSVKLGHRKVILPPSVKTEKRVRHKVDSLPGVMHRSRQLGRSPVHLVRRLFLQCSIWGRPVL